MPAITSIINPAVPDDQEITVFNTTELKNLGLVLMSGGKGQDPDEIFDASSAGAQAQPGFIVDQSSIASIMYNNLVAVYGFTARKDTNVYNNISMLSPVYAPIGDIQVEATNISIAACNSDDGSTSMLAYLTGSDDTSRTLNGYVLGIGPSPQPSTTGQILAGSELALFYTPETQQFYCIFQHVGTSNQPLQEQNMNGGLTPIHSTDDAAQNTPIAVCYVPGASGAASGCVYLYYVNTSSSIKRVYRSAAPGGQWNSATDVTALPVAAGSMIGCTYSNGIKHLFYVPQGETHITHVRDNRK